MLQGKQMFSKILFIILGDLLVGRTVLACMLVQVLVVVLVPMNSLQSVAAC